MLTISLVATHILAKGDREKKRLLCIGASHELERTLQTRTRIHQQLSEYTSPDMPLAIPDFEELPHLVALMTSLRRVFSFLYGRSREGWSIEWVQAISYTQIEGYCRPYRLT